MDNAPAYAIKAIEHDPRNLDESSLTWCAPFVHDGFGHAVTHLEDDRIAHEAMVFWGV